MNEVDQISKLEDKRARVLKSLYLLAKGSVTTPVKVDELKEKSDVGNDCYPILRYLQHKGLLKKSNMIVRITEPGIDEAEAMIKSENANKQYLVLRKIYDMGGVRHTEWVVITELVKELGMEYREVNEILLDLEERKGLINGTEHAVKLTPAGIEEVEETRQHPERPTTNFPANIIYNTFNAPVGGVQQQTQNSTQNITQNITITNNPDFDNAISKLLELVQTAPLPDEDKEEVTEEIVKVNKLALKEPAPGLLEKAKLKVEIVKLGLMGTDIALKAAPYIETVLTYFQRKYGG